jgi:hypothetical protein
MCPLHVKALYHIYACLLRILLNLDYINDLKKNKTNIKHILRRILASSQNYSLFTLKRQQKKEENKEKSKKKKVRFQEVMFFSHLLYHKSSFYNLKAK